MQDYITICLRYITKPHGNLSRFVGVHSVGTIIPIVPTLEHTVLNNAEFHTAENHRRSESNGSRKPLEGYPTSEGFR